MSPFEPADRASPWFHGMPGPGPGGLAEQARRWQELADACEHFVRHLRGGTAGGRRPVSDPEVGRGFWSPVPVPGFRLWHVLSGCLQGVRQTWLRPELEACCPRRGSGAPHTDGLCRCGIYALKAPESLPPPERMVRRPAAGVAYGLVALSGKVVEHERGYRAGRAAVVAVVAIYRGRAVAGSDRRWVERLFQQPAAALEEAEVGRWPRTQPMDASAEGVIGFLRDEARRFEATWTLASSNG